MAVMIRHRTSCLMAVAISAAISAMIFLGFFGPEGLVMKWEGLWKLAVVVPAALIVNHAAERFVRTQLARGHELAEEINSAIGGTAGKVKLTILLAVGLELLSVMCEGPTNVVGLIAGVALPFCATAAWLAGIGKPLGVRAAFGLAGGLAGGAVTVYMVSSFFCMYGAAVAAHAKIAVESVHPRVACLWLAGPRPAPADLWWLLVYCAAIGVTGSFAVGSGGTRPTRTTVKWMIVTWIALVALRNCAIYAGTDPSADVVVPAYIIPVEIAVLAQLVGWAIAMVADGNVAGALWPNTEYWWRRPRAAGGEAAVLTS